ncbi:type II secretion system inner membrane protein GspF [Celerinatantimonas diazotrophica]|uniref:Type II secretion system protein F (GspF) n=1 Tax=Celerinatantimonas diazotrophica TaxID=412034 RepID=A0A4R1KDU2_9GAMM|nr:type II secretion system inner membrane protein GspF [Celerinatantimonas diazotrophica]TCK62752.1 type II secretion system protein F (GspF) [Celerinatantimonas diazotrophica]CAG9298382.1 Type II secretion system protein F [Celerinatantimonas diazotrophica]
MAAYQYQALDEKGRTKKGVIDGDSARLVRQQLRLQGLTPLAIEATSEPAQRDVRVVRRKVRTIKYADLALLTRQLATLIAASLPVEESLRAVAHQSNKNQIKALVFELRSQVAQGFSLSESMAGFPRIFDDLYRAMVAAGERTGHLDLVLNRLADYIEQRQQIRMKTLQALIYPAILVVVSISVIFILLTAVVPKIVAQFVYMGQQLPFSTRVLMGLSHALAQNWWWLLLVIAAAILAAKMALKKPEIRKQFHRYSLRLPLIGKVALEQQTARFARTLSILTASAVPLVEAMQIASQVLSNMHAREQLTLASESVRNGNPLLDTLSQTQLFSPMLLQMIASGEQTGELEQMLLRAADFQDREFSYRVSIALTIFEPVLIITMAAIVLFIVMAIIQPILALNNMVG